MRIMDKFNCQYCNKEVVLESDNDLVEVDKYDFDCACKNCFNKISYPRMEHDLMLKSEWYEIQGNYLN